MQLRSFVGATMEEVKGKVRAALGDDAEIASTRDLGGEGIQIVCAIRDANSETAADPLTPDTDVGLRAQQALIWHRVPGGMLQRTLHAIPGAAENLPAALTSAFSATLRFDQLEELCEGGKLVMLVGPPGSGKTVMLAKLAVHALMRGVRVAMLGCDQIRLAADQQLKGYASRLQCSYHEAPSARIAFLALVTRLLHDGVLVLGDTPGCNPFLREDYGLLLRLCAPAQARKILLLPAALDRQSTILLATAFKPLGLTGVMGSMLDLEPRAGPLLAAADQLQLPLLALGKNARINDGLKSLSSEQLAEYIITVTPESAYQLDPAAFAPPAPVVANSDAATNEQAAEGASGQAATDKPASEQPDKKVLGKSFANRAKSFAEIDFSDIPTANNLIVIGSGKGGVGKTWFAITLAQALTRLQRRVLLFDADLGLANVDIQLGLMPPRDLLGVIQGQLSLKEVITSYPQGGFDVIAGRSGSGALTLATPNQVHDILSDLVRIGTSYDYVLLDLGAGIDPLVRLFSAYGGVSLLISSEEPTSIADTYAFIKVLHVRRARTNLRIVINLAESISSGNRSYETLQKAARQFLNLDVPLAGIVPRDRAVIDAIRHQTPLLTRSPVSLAARGVVNIATGLVRGKLSKNFTDSETSAMDIN